MLSPSGKCVQCISSCGGSCDASNPTLCTGCMVGFESLEGKCVRCPLNCQTCANGVCSRCKAGFRIVQTDSGVSCQKDCVYPCRTCTETNCLVCATNFTMSANGGCLPDLTCGGRGCISCMAGSYKDTDGSCKSCLSNCVSCTNQTFCLGCGEGYFANSAGGCEVCPEGTAVCLDRVSSVLCKPGYIKEAVSV